MTYLNDQKIILICKILQQINLINLGCDLGSSLITASKYVPIYLAFCIRYPTRRFILVWCGMILFQSFDGFSLVNCLWNLHPAAKPAASISFLLVLSSHDGLNVAQFNLNWTWNEFQGNMNICFTLIYKWNKSSTRLLHSHLLKLWKIEKCCILLIKLSTHILVHSKTLSILYIILHFSMLNQGKSQILCFIKKEKSSFHQK